MPECTDYASNMHMHIHIMHVWAYPSMSAWMCILVWAIPGWIWMNTGYCMNVLCQICIRMIIWKKPNSGYDYMHIWATLVPTNPSGYLTNTGKRPWQWGFTKIRTGIIWKKKKEISILVKTSLMELLLKSGLCSALLKSHLLQRFHHFGQN